MPDFSEFLLRYGEAKTALSDATGAGEDLLHVHAGLLIYVLATLVFRRRMGSPIPLVLVILFAGGNELIDWLADKPAAPFEPIIDIANTVFWPTILYLVARRWR